MVTVNLDALIPREDFEIRASTKAIKKIDSIAIRDITPDSFFFPVVRKPDFQRETNEWDQERVCQFIKSFVEGDLIPAIILWRSESGLIFVIDGSHRLSSLIAWVNDDYGDGVISKPFYNGIVPDEQLNIADRTRKLIDKKVGSYQNFKLALEKPDKVRDDIVNNARELGVLAIQLQWVEGNSEKAEDSFFKINQQSTPLDTTEIKLLISRRQPNSIATRAIINSGTGHKYWSRFSEEKQCQVEKLAKEINDMLFQPSLQTPIKTLDLPVCGKLYSNETLSMILAFVNIANHVEDENKKLQNDETGDTTIRFLKNNKTVVQLFNSNHASSLGLHPLLYCYSRTGRYRTVSFLATVYFVIKLVETKHLNDFIDIRAKFEQFLFEHNYLVSPIMGKYRSVPKSYKPIANFWLKIIEELKNNKTIDIILQDIVKDNNLDYLKIGHIHNSTASISGTSKNFSQDQKSEIFILETFSQAPRCRICNGLIHCNSISIDHKNRKRDGGSANVDNGQVTHPYCNTGYKN
ncbi:MAG: DUF262 domain-containing protein [Microcystis aeruginosa LG13-11]|nr:DUF262 domain-containing protein [Microcystis aeruginosa LG13-11]